MKHPFEKLFDEALRKSTPEDNQLIEAVYDLEAKGYSRSEIYAALSHFAHGLIDETRDAIAADALADIADWAKDD